MRLWSVLSQLGLRRVVLTNAWRVETQLQHKSHSLNSLKGGYIRDYIGDHYRGC